MSYKQTILVMAKNIGITTDCNLFCTQPNKWFSDTFHIFRCSC